MVENVRYMFSFPRLVSFPMFYNCNCAFQQIDVVTIWKTRDFDYETYRTEIQNSI